MHLDAFVSAIVTMRNAESWAEPVLRTLCEQLQATTSDFEIVVVDNASTDGTVVLLEELCTVIPNIQVFSLGVAAPDNVVTMAGLEQCLGDFILLLTPTSDELQFIPNLIDSATQGYDVVLGQARDLTPPGHSLHCVLLNLFGMFYKFVTRHDVAVDAPMYRLMSRRVLNYILQHEAAFVLYRTLPLIAGFRTATFEFNRSATNTVYKKPKPIHKAAAEGLALFTASSVIPIRFVSILCLGSSFLSVLYSFYVIAVYLFNHSVAPGWTTLSLQISGLFFLMFVALAVLSEYIIQISNLAARRPLYHVGREFRSRRVNRRAQLNVFTATGRTP